MMKNESDIRTRIHNLLYGIMEYAMFQMSMENVDKFIKESLMELYRRKIINSNHSVKIHNSGYSYSIHCFPTMENPTEIELLYSIDSKGNMIVSDYDKDDYYD